MKKVLFALSMLLLASCAYNSDKAKTPKAAPKENASNQKNMQQNQPTGCDGSCCPHKCTRNK